MLNPDALQQTERKKEVRSRQRASTSCMECRRRKQKCNKTRDKKCTNCERRYPPVPCVYEVLKKSTKRKDAVVELEFAGPRVQDGDTSNTLSLTTLYEEQDFRSTTPYSGGLSQLPTRSSSRSSWHEGYREWGKDSRPPDPSDQAVHILPLLDVASYFRAGKYIAYPEIYNLHSSIPTGGVALEPLLSLPVEASRRNAELFHFFIQRLSPFTCTIDGSNAPAKFMDRWLPFLIQSPISIPLSLLTASYFQAAYRQIKVENSVDAMAAKGRLITLINEHIVSHSKGVDDESIAAVMSLAYNELVYSDDKSTLAHMHGLREMVKTRGGVHNVSFDLLRKLLLRTDFQIACTLECPLFLHDNDFLSTIQPLTTYPIHLDCPFLPSPIRFIDNLHIHNIAPETAQIFDDVRWLVTSILHLLQSQHNRSSPEHKKFMATTQWISSRLSSSSAPTSPHHATIHTTILLTTQVLLSSLLSQQPLSRSLTPTQLQKIWQSMWSVPLPVWKLHPGIFFYVLLVVNPGARERPEGRFLKGMLGATAVAVGTFWDDGEDEDEDRVGGRGWDILKGIVGSVLVVQRWLRNGGGEEGERDDGRADGRSEDRSGSIGQKGKVLKL